MMLGLIVSQKIYHFILINYRNLEVDAYYLEPH